MQTIQVMHQNNGHQSDHTIFENKAGTGISDSPHLNLGQHTDSLPKVFSGRFSNQPISRHLDLHAGSRNSKPHIIDCFYNNLFWSWNLFSENKYKSEQGNMTAQPYCSGDIGKDVSVDEALKDIHFNPIIVNFLIFRAYIICPALCTPK